MTIGVVVGVRVKVLVRLGAANPNRSNWHPTVFCIFFDQTDSPPRRISRLIFLFSVRTAVFLQADLNNAVNQARWASRASTG